MKPAGFGNTKAVVEIHGPGDGAIDLPAFLTQQELATRWRISPRTLERWRWSGSGPSFTRIGGRVVYGIDDVEAYERLRRAEIKPTILGKWR